ncbi:hypothetical protein ACFY5D_07890 [Paeniglutamicibacter sp. NPDC012692]|uniref:hypothetical protein n=1 Tax=Paeniglutamicibacter sp. NPDC012692 TaxID=3364388 RepID=UPI0036A9DF13
MDYQGKAAGGIELAPGADFQPELIGLALPKGSGIGPALEEAMRGLVESGTYGRTNAKWGIPEQTNIGASELSR